MIVIFWNGGCYEINVFPDHWVNKPRKEVINKRRRIPEVLNKSHQDSLAISISIFRVDWIWAISALTNTESWSPSAWYLARIANASSFLSLLMRYRGLSGTKLRKVNKNWNKVGIDWGGNSYKINTICIKEGAIWRSEGILHAQSFGMFTVPKAIEAAIIWPIPYEALNKDVKIARSLG